MRSPLIKVPHFGPLINELPRVNETLVWRQQTMELKLLHSSSVHTALTVDRLPHAVQKWHHVDCVCLTLMKRVD